MTTKPVTPAADWHPADIKAALEKRGISLRRLATESGYAQLQRVLVSPWWGAEQIVAKALELRPEEIWPTRYRLPRTRAERMTRKEAGKQIAAQAVATQRKAA
ncbi:MAG: helix-turn-helix domain-containing protein [Burkholderiales bacterium]|nr:helix-turn-helix domain-containing protein [Burkholderiales bacterium]